MRGVIRRKPREAYARVIVEHAGVECIIGLEWREGDTLRFLSADVEVAAHHAVVTFGQSMPDEDFAEAIEKALVAEWPDRAYFIEVGRDARHWIQIFQPWGIPRET